MPISRQERRLAQRCAAAALAVGLAGCSGGSDGPPDLVVDRSACAHCSMLISEPTLAAAWRAAGDERLFDDLGCLEAWLSGPEPRGGQVWVADLDGGGWLRAEEAVFVRSSALRTPMGGGIVAVRSVARAEELAAEHGGRVVSSLPQLLDREERDGR